MKLKQYLNEAFVQSEPIKSITMINKERLTKRIFLSIKGDTYEIVVDTESLAPTTVRGVKSTLVRSKFTDEKKALKSFDTKVNNAKKKEWKEKSISRWSK